MARLLLTGARAPITLDLARCFNAAGHTVFVGDTSAWHLCRGSRAVAGVVTLPPPNRRPQQFITALCQAVQRHNIDWLLPTCEEIFFVAAGRAQLTPLCNVFVDDSAKLSHLHNKWQFFQTARRYNLSTPESRLLTSPAQATALLNRPLVLKPVYSRFAARTIICPRQPAQIPDDISPRQPWVAQDFVAGRALCSYSVAHAGRLTAHCCYAAPFTAGPGAGIAFSAEAQPAVLNWVRQFVAQEQFTGQISFDFIESDESETGHLTAIECNPRPTSGVHLFAPQDDLPGAILTPGDSLLMPPPGRAAMLWLPMLLYGLPVCRSGAALRRWLATVGRSRAVLFSARDPLPALGGQWLGLGRLLYLSLKHRVSLIEASTLDIEWNGEPLCYP